VKAFLNSAFESGLVADAINRVVCRYKRKRRPSDEGTPRERPNDSVILPDNEWREDNGRPGVGPPTDILPALDGISARQLHSSAFSPNSHSVPSHSSQTILPASGRQEGVGLTSSDATPAVVTPAAPDQQSEKQLHSSTSSLGPRLNPSQQLQAYHWMSEYISDFDGVRDFHVDPTDLSMSAQPASQTTEHEAGDWFALSRQTLPDIHSAPENG
jgi:hypothetical protein